MQTQPPAHPRPHPLAELGRSARDLATGTLRRTLAWVRSDETRDASRQIAEDLAEGGWRVIRSARMPTRQGLVDFFTHQVVVNAVGWIAGLGTAHVVTRLFEVRGFRNLWGFAGSEGRTLVSADDYRLIMTVTGFTFGLLSMLFVRHLLMRWIAETRALRAERRGESPRSSVSTPPPSSSPGVHLDELEPDEQH